MEQSTSDHGWDLAAQGEVLRPLIAECRALGVRVSLFMDAQAEHMAAAKALGADRVELYTESWANACGSEAEAAVLAQFQAARAAAAAGLGVNAGHGLNLHNLRAFAVAIPELDEVSVGHALIADALELGMAGAVQAYLNCLQ